MFDALSGMACFVTASVSLIYATRIAWVCGKKCDFGENPKDKKQVIFENIPASALVYFLGFVVLFSFLIDGILTIFISALTSAILLSSLVVSTAMPDIKFRTAKDKDKKPS